MSYSDIKAVTAYANNNMKLCPAAKEVGIDYRTMSLRLDQIYRKTQLDPKCFRDLAEMVEAIEEETR